MLLPKTMPAVHPSLGAPRQRLRLLPDCLLTCALSALPSFPLPLQLPESLTVHVPPHPFNPAPHRSRPHAFLAHPLFASFCGVACLGKWRRQPRAQDRGQGQIGQNRAQGGAARSSSELGRCPVGHILEGSKWGKWAIRVQLFVCTCYRGMFLWCSTKPATWRIHSSQMP